MIRAFACAIRDLVDYIPGPDMGTDERCMAWVKDEIGRAVGLPPVLGGIPLDEIGATGFGLVTAIEAALPYCGLSLKGARVAVQGFGAVGRHAARFLGDKGAVLVAAADTSATLYDPKGLDVTDLARHKLAGGQLADFPAGKKQPLDAIIDVACDIWIPAARPDVLHAGNAARLQAKLVAQGANIPATAEAEVELHARGISGPARFHRQCGRRNLCCRRISRRHRGRSLCCDCREDRPQHEPGAGTGFSNPQHATDSRARTGRAAGQAGGGLPTMALMFRFARTAG